MCPAVTMTIHNITNHIVSIGIIVIFAVTASALFLLSHSTHNITAIFGTVTTTHILSQQTIDEKLGMDKINQLTKPETVTKNISIKTATPLAEKFIIGCYLSFILKPSADTITRGGHILYEIIIKNIGGTICRNTSYSFYYSSYEKYISAIPRPTISNYYWNIGVLAPGAKYHSHIETHSNLSTNETFLQNEACATSDNVITDICVNNTINISDKKTILTTPTTLNQINTSVLYTPPARKEFGVWIWRSPIQMSTRMAKQLITTAKQNGINAIYITIDDYLKTTTFQNEDKKNGAVTAYFAKLNQFIIEAHAQNITVDVEGGAPDWAEPKNKWKGYALIDFVKHYNARYPDAKIRALQYDVESYLLPEYASNKTSVLTSFVSFINTSVTKMRGVNAGFSVVIPHFYDSAQKWTPPIVYNGKTAYVFTQLLHILGRKKTSTLILMSYRNFFYGNNGVQALSTPELTESSNKSYTTKIVIAQETGNVNPSYVTYFGESKSDYLHVVKLIYSRFKNFPSFQGVATDYLTPFLKLR